MENKEEHKTPLEKLVVEKEEVDDYILYELLKDYVTIEKETGEIMFSEKIKELNKKQLVLLTLLAQKARARLSSTLGRTFEDGLRAKEIEKLSGIKGGTLRSILVTLHKNEKLINQRDKKYFIPTSVIPRLKEYLVPKTKGKT